MSFYSQINSGSESLIECSDLSVLNVENGYSIVPQVHPSWKTSAKRLLVVVETVDSLDLRNQSLLSGDTNDKGSRRDEHSNHNPMRSILSNILDLAIKMLVPYKIDLREDPDIAFGIANFNARKIRNLDTHLQKSAFPSFAERVTKIISKLKPTHVLVCGDTANAYLLQVLDCPEGTLKHLQPDKVYLNSEYKRGWVLKRKLGKHEFFYTPTLDLESLYNPSKRIFDEDEEDDSNDGSDKYAAADLLYFVTRNICNLFAEKMLHDLSRIKPNPIYVDTIAKFDSFYENLLGAELVGTDLETRSLTNLNNKIYIAQFAFTTNEAYVIPVKHPKSPFSEEESDYIYGKIRKFLRSKKSKILVFINGVFDTRVFRTQLSLPIIPYHKIWEITAGEQLLDENIGLFSRLRMYKDGEYIKTSYQNLRNLFCMYGNDLYYRMPFSKEERHLTGSVEPDDPDMLKYCALDAQSMIGIALEQRKRAAAERVKLNLKSKLQSYGDYFETHLLHQMSNTVNAISHMEQNGSPIDIKYLEHLMGSSSPLHKLMKDTLTELTNLSSVKKANAKILSSAGKAQTSLFGDDVSMSVFNPNKREHKETLFFDVMRLPVVSYTKTKQRAIDKNFVTAYRTAYKEVELFETLTKAGKLVSTYVKGWINILKSSMDSSVDFCLRPSFGFFTIVTGRLNSFNPSLQQVPSRGKLADFIKRAFIPPVGYLNIKYDYSSHEVRGWSILSFDKVLAGSFLEGLSLRRRLIKAINEKDKVELRAELKKKGDVHIQNAYRFFKRWIEKSDPLRDAVKALVFGVIYGKGVKTLARDLRNQRLGELKQKKEALEKELLLIAKS